MYKSNEKAKKIIYITVVGIFILEGDNIFSLYLGCSIDGCCHSNPLLA